jgi:hypothetical protein
VMRMTVYNAATSTRSDLTIVPVLVDFRLLRTIMYVA